MFFFWILFYLPAIELYLKQSAPSDDESSSWTFGQVSEFPFSHPSSLKTFEDFVTGDSHALRGLGGRDHARYIPVLESSDWDVGDDCKRRLTPDTLAFSQSVRGRVSEGFRFNCTM